MSNELDDLLERNLIKAFEIMDKITRNDIKVDMGDTDRIKELVADIKKGK